MMSNAAATRDRISDVALRLFEQRGFDEVTVNEVAAAAGVSHMTVFRHFATKEDLVVADPFDPIMAAIVSEQPTSLGAFARARLGLIASARLLAEAPSSELESVMRRIHLTAGHPRLRARMWEGTHETARAIAEVLGEGGATPAESAAAAGACLGALTFALLQWITDPEPPTLSEAVIAALDSLGVRP